MPGPNHPRARAALVVVAATRATAYAEGASKPGLPNVAGRPSATYYLEIAREAYEEAVQCYRLGQKDDKAEQWFASVWDAQNQISAALSWAEEDADVWFEAANLTFQMASLTRLSMSGHHFVVDALDFWAYALRLDADACGGAADSPRSQHLRSWLQVLAKAPAAPRMWPEVTDKTWEDLHQRFAGISIQEALRRLPQRRFGRSASAHGMEVPEVPAQPASASCHRADLLTTAAVAVAATDAAVEETDTSSTTAAAQPAAAVAGGRLEVLFPTFIYRKDLRGELGEDFLAKLSRAAVVGYVSYRDRFLRQLEAEGSDVREIPDSRVSNGFFRSQADFLEKDFERAEVRARWPDLWGTKEFRQLLGLARAACLEYLRRAGVILSAMEVEASSMYLWAAVYPQDAASRASHDWHTHPDALASGVIYAANPRRTPLVFADPRGAPPASRQDRQMAQGGTFHPRAPFDASYRVVAEEGELVVFPPWLLHSVPSALSGDGSGWRVAFPFNLLARVPGRAG
eukprot:CAMPEP_0175195012 /NCGR_PEP_ID=MMETSP0093-20121207/6783_1 /TAXON_ID=311494 /ORGANISM="Alexandrium monilatum, Strain CCMP3105" /LENGTH=514 /DNA_ID=CAMNT_0016487943 /DNA_START=1 /DNA_END=1542 /DNA_ORIENTATION=+